MTNVEIEIDGKTLSVPSNQTIIEAADAAGIYIPRFCYHKHLSIAANCRMCLVEVEKSPKTLPACATPVMSGMKVSTRSKKTIDAQRSVMEFLLINHPLDCPICDQGGECELQDLSMGYGADHSEFDDGKRAVPELELGPLISTEMTRCIHCTRCVRFGEEVAGLRELGVTQRGGHAEITTYVEHTMTSPVSGNIIDLCPVGALTSKPFRFTARAWELRQAASISPHDAFGTNIHVHTLTDQVMRVVPKENAKLNQTWIADRDRFSYTALASSDRLDTPLIKINNEWQVATWEQALNLTVAHLQDIAKKHSDQLVGLLHPSSTLEECYLMQKMIRGLGSANIDHRLREEDTQDEANAYAYPGLPFSLTTLEESEIVLIIGANIAHDMPMLNVRFRQMAKKGTVFMALNAYDYDMHFPIQHKIIVSPTLWVEKLNSMLHVLEGDSKRASDQSVKEVVSPFAGKKKVSIILGTQVAEHPNAACVRFAVQQLAHQCHAKIGTITAGANAAGAWLAGAVSHLGPAFSKVAGGQNAVAALKNAHRAYVLLNIEPTLDVANPKSAMQTLKQADFVVSLSTYRDLALMDVAHVMLPVAPFTETSGTYVNIVGDWQSFRGVAKPFRESRPAWKVLRVLAELLGLTDCQYDSSEAVRDELSALCTHLPEHHGVLIEPKKRVAEYHERELVGLKEVLIYRGDAILRRAKPLQDLQSMLCTEMHHAVKLHPKTAEALNIAENAEVTVKQGDSSIQARVKYDDKLALDVMWMAAGTEMSAGLDQPMGIIQID